MIRRAWEAAGFVPEAGLQAAVVQTHYKPRVRTRLLLRVVVPRPSTGKRPRVQYLFVQAYADHGAAERRVLAAAKKPLACVGPPVFHVEEWAAACWALPNGPMLRAAKMLLRRRRARRFFADLGLASADDQGSVARPELIRYVPRRRALFRTRLLSLSPPLTAYVKLHAPGEDRRSAENLRLAALASEDGRAGFLVPRLVAHDERRRAVVMTEVPGRPLTSLLASADDALLRRVGAALAGLHGSAVRPVARWTWGEEMRYLRGAMRDVVTALPRLRDHVGRTVESLERRARELAFPEDVPVHGNMFGDQVLVGEGGAVAFVDWDDLRLGDPLFDVGRLAAHVEFDARRRGEAADDSARRLAAFVAGYEDAAGRPADAARLAWHVATARLMRAKISALRPLVVSWEEDVEAALRRADELASSARFLGRGDA